MIFERWRQMQSDTEKLYKAICEWRASPERARMEQGERYLRGEHDILRRRRTVTGADGLPHEVYNLPNNRIVDNQYARMVTQKANYLCGRPFMVRADNEELGKTLESAFDAHFKKLLKDVHKDALNCGIGWIYVYIDEGGALAFRRFEPREIMPLWAPDGTLASAVRIYKSADGDKAELYTKDGIRRYKIRASSLLEEERIPYAQSGGEGFSWGVLPMVPFRLNERCLPLIGRVKTLQDALNGVLSDMVNNLSEDCRNSVLVLENYDGESLEEFRQNLAAYGVIKVKSVDGAAGDVRVLEVSVDVNSYKSAAEILRRAIVENACGADSSKSSVGANPNQLNILSMYADADLDANDTEAEFTASLMTLCEAIKAYSGAEGGASIIFDRDIIVSESEAIENCGKSKGVIAYSIIAALHPWTRNRNDLKEEWKNGG